MLARHMKLVDRPLQTQSISTFAESSVGPCWSRKPGPFGTVHQQITSACYDRTKHMEICLSSTPISSFFQGLEIGSKNNPMELQQKRDETKRTAVKIRSFEEPEADVTLGANVYYSPTCAHLIPSHIIPSTVTRKKDRVSRI